MWTTERTAELAHLWKQRGMTAQELADRFGVTRNSVIGKVHRLMPELEDRRGAAPTVWANDADEIIRTHWETHAVSKIHEMLRLKGFEASLSAIRRRGHRLTTGATARRPVEKKVRGKVNNIAAARLTRAKLRETFGLPPIQRVLRVNREPPPAPDMLMLSILDLETNSCRFPIGHPKEPGFAFCGAKKDETGSYCAFHRNLCYQAPESASRQRRAINYAVKRYA